MTNHQVNLRPTWSITIKVVIGVLVLIVIGLAIFRFQVVFTPLIIGGIMAYIFQPLVNFLENRVRLPRGLATAVIYLLLLSLSAPIAFTLTPFIGKQVSFLQNELIDFINYIQTLSPETTIDIIGFELAVAPLVESTTNSLREVVTSAAPESIEFVLGVAETALMVIFTLLIGFYLTKDAPKVVDWIAGLVPPGYDKDARRLLQEIDQVWGAFFKGQLILAMVVTIIMTVVSSILGLPQPILMGLLAGLLEFLPSVGHTIWIITALILALLEGSSTLPIDNNLLFAAIVGLAHFGFTQFDLNYLIPRIIGRGVHLHPMVVIIGIIIGFSLGGVLGVALAAPSIATLRILARYIYAMLFDLDPFPMVGPPSAPKKVRQTQLEEMQSVEPTDERPSLKELIGRKSQTEAEPDETDHTVTQEGSTS